MTSPQRRDNLIGLTATDADGSTTSASRAACPHGAAASPAVR
jgi:hypothetical protein